MRIIKVESCMECPYLKPYGPFSLHCGITGEIVCTTSLYSWQYELPRYRLPGTMAVEGGIPDWCPLLKEEVK
jgi:hypothetical protein